MPGKCFVAIKYWVGVREKVGYEFFAYNDDIGNFFDSYKILTLDNIEPTKPASIGVVALAEASKVIRARISPTTKNGALITFIVMLPTPHFSTLTNNRLFVKSFYRFTARVM